MTAADLARLAPTRRYATLVGVTVEALATVTDELIETHDRIIGKIFNKAKRAHAERFQETGRAVNDKVRLFGKIGQILVDAKQAGTDPFDAIDTAIGWDLFVASVADAQHFAQPEDFDFLYLILESYASIRRYSPSFLDVLDFRSASTTTDLLAGVNLLRRLNRENLRKIPADAPTGFVKKRWEIFLGSGWNHVDRE